MKLTISAPRVALFTCAVAGLLGGLSLPAAVGSQMAPAPTSAKNATVSASPSPVQGAPAFVGPRDSDMRPASNALDLTVRTLPPGAEREWLTKDVEMIGRVRSILPPATQASVFLRALNAKDTQEQTDLGFGLRVDTARVAGGYATCWFTLASHADAILSLRTECTANTPASDGLGLTLREALGPGFSIAPGANLVARAEYESPSANNTARAALDRSLGAQAPVPIDTLTPELSKAYDLLVSPLEELAVGNACGIVGASPAGRDAVLALIAAKRIDLLRNVLRGPNPGGRIYAALALTKLGALNAQDEGIVETLSSSATPVTTCGGCVFTKETGAEAMSMKLD